jgi:hypothetical protein
MIEYESKIGEIREDFSMSRSIITLIFALSAVFFLNGAASAQDFILRESEDNVLAASMDRTDVTNVFEDRDGDGVYDALTLNGKFITGDIRIRDAQGFQFEDGRSIALYPSDWNGLPEPGNSALLGFIHYFDEENISTYLAIVAEQAIGDDTTHGLAVFFYDSSGLRVGAPTTMFMEKSLLSPLPIYQEWRDQGLDFGIGTNPINSQFFVYAKDLGLTDTILIVMFQLYQ